VEYLVKGSAAIDVLIRESGLAPSKVASTLVALELKRLVRMLPGRKVELVG
jgi:predicted Rossmann fold nucleotide-binding protein DprA/Smf involved in DNA uptake